MADVDFIEWRFRNGKLVPVGVMEVTRVDNDKAVSEGYLRAIVGRFESRDIQARIARHVAEALKTKAYIILFRQDCSEFWVYNLTDGTQWAHYNTTEMEAFLKRL